MACGFSIGAGAGFVAVFATATRAGATLAAGVAFDFAITFATGDFPFLVTGRDIARAVDDVFER